MSKKRSDFYEPLRNNMDGKCNLSKMFPGFDQEFYNHLEKNLNSYNRFIKCIESVKEENKEIPKTVTYNYNDQFCSSLSCSDETKEKLTHVRGTILDKLENELGYKLESKNCYFVENDDCLNITPNETEGEPTDEDKSIFFDSNGIVSNLTIKSMFNNGSFEVQKIGLLLLDHNLSLIKNTDDYINSFFMNDSEFCDDYLNKDTKMIYNAAKERNFFLLPSEIVEKQKDDFIMQLVDNAEITGDTTIGTDPVFGKLPAIRIDSEQKKLIFQYDEKSKDQLKKLLILDKKSNSEVAQIVESNPRKLYNEYEIDKNNFLWNELKAGRRIENKLLSYLEAADQVEEMFKNYGPEYYELNKKELILTEFFENSFWDKNSIPKDDKTELPTISLPLGEAGSNLYFFTTHQCRAMEAIVKQLLLLGLDKKEFLGLKLEYQGDTKVQHTATQETQKSYGLYLNGEKIFDFDRGNYHQFNNHLGNLLGVDFFSENIEKLSVSKEKLENFSKNEISISSHIEEGIRNVPLSGESKYHWVFDLNGLVKLLTNGKHELNPPNKELTKEIKNSLSESLDGKKIIYNDDVKSNLTEMYKKALEKDNTHFEFKNGELYYCEEDNTQKFEDAKKMLKKWGYTKGELNEEGSILRFEDQIKVKTPYRGDINNYPQQLLWQFRTNNVVNKYFVSLGLGRDLEKQGPFLNEKNKPAICIVPLERLENTVSVKKWGYVIAQNVMEQLKTIAEKYPSLNIKTSHEISNTHPISDGGKGTVHEKYYSIKVSSDGNTLYDESKQNDGYYPGWLINLTKKITRSVLNEEINLKNDMINPFLKNSDPLPKLNKPLKYLYDENKCIRGIGMDFDDFKNYVLGREQKSTLSNKESWDSSKEKMIAKNCEQNKSNVHTFDK